MPILIKECEVIDGGIVFPTQYTKVEYLGRVIEVRTRWAMRNHSDTLDYTDMRMTECTEAFVWHGPTKEVTVYDQDGKWTSETRQVPQDILKQFSWVDCTNLFAWRGSDIHTPIVDANLEEGTGDPAMWLAWDQYQDALEKEALRLLEEQKKRQAEEAIRQEAEAKKQAKKQAKLDESKVEAEKHMNRLPAKGTEMTYQGFTGKLFWSRVQMYRGKWKASFGLKDAKGNVQWGDAEKLP